MNKLSQHQVGVGWTLRRRRGHAGLLGVALVALVAVLSACGSDGGSGDGGGSPKVANVVTETKLPWGTFTLSDRTADKLRNGGKLKIQVISYDSSAPFWKPFRKGISDASAKLKVDASFVGPAEASTEEQVANFESAVTQGIDGIVVITPDPDTLTPLIDKAVGQGIPVLTSNIDAPDSKRFAYVGQDSVKSGQAAGREFLTAFYKDHPKGGGPYKVITAGSDRAQAYVRDRFKGFKSALDPTGDFEVLGVQSTTFDNTKAYDVVANAFRANPDAKGLYMTDGTIVGGGEYLDRGGLASKVTAVGHNFEPGTEALMKSGAIDASIGQFPYKQGYQPVADLVTLLRRGQLPSCQPICEVGAQVANQANVERFDFKATG